MAKRTLGRLKRRRKNNIQVKQVVKRHGLSSSGRRELLAGSCEDGNGF